MSPMVVTARMMLVFTFFLVKTSAIIRLEFTQEISFTIFSYFCCLIQATICLIDFSSTCLVELILSNNVLPSIFISIGTWLEFLLLPEVPEHISANILAMNMLSSIPRSMLRVSALLTLLQTCWIVFDFHPRGLTFPILFARKTLLPPTLLAPSSEFL